MLRLVLLLSLPVFALAGIYYGYDYIPPAYPPPYYQGSYPYYYGGYPGYYNPIGTGSAWAAGGGLVGNTLSFLVG
ncbi:hypothetical protein ANCCEY_12018 [Ancylostoma ceylanicum]|uniref:Uncharacterized protein n=1 Tax=Ancylostoma ceylanicum TaxID=53326 RepID=A0A0D6LG40_9BILA|nr:hypothetical protein ANCCEY_12018 [Ancylostoma ceylanicum]